MKYLNLFVTIIFFFCTKSFSQTRVGALQFNDEDTFHKTELMINGAGQRERLYAIALYFGIDFNPKLLDSGSKVAEKDIDMGLTIKMIANKVSADKLKELIRLGLDRATNGNSYEVEDKIRRFLGFIPKKIERFEIFKILYSKGGKLTLFKKREILGVIEDAYEFKKALFKIWLGDNPVSEKLKFDLLAAQSPNPILGKWKIYDKKTGVATKIVQTYMLKNRVYGMIEEMLRHSQRDDVCFECKGEDKNQKVEGLVILKRLKPVGNNRYAQGTITDVVNGNVSDCQAWLDKEDQNILHLKYKGSRGTQHWKKIK